jgi:hypothetical protein
VRCRGNGRKFRKDAMGKNVVSAGVIYVQRVVIIRRHRPHHSGQHCHRVRVITKAVEKTQHSFIQHGMRANRCVERIKLGFGG